MKQSGVRLGIFLLLIPAGAWLALQLIAIVGEPAEARSEGGQLDELVAELQTARPDYLVIGDSMLTTRMEAEAISQLSGRKFYFYARGGASSAAWFLYLKNVVFKSGVHPRAIIFIFRNQYLTWPRFRVNGQYRANLERVDDGDEPLLSRLLLPDPPQPWDAVGWASRWLVEPGGVFYAKTASGEFHSRLENLALDLTSFGAKKAERRAYLTKRFDLASLRADVAAELPAEGSNIDNSDAGRPRVFDPSPSRSFLPHMVQMAKDAGIPLVFFRVKCRPGPDQVTAQSEELAEYTRSLKGWLQSQNCFFYDETSDPKITLDLYHDGDHLSEAAKPWWTDYFWKRMAPLLP
jgi:hypothetical protein